MAAEETQKSASGSEDAGKFSGWQIARWLVCLAVVAATAIYYFVGVTEATSCQQVLNAAGAVRQLCGPPSLTAFVPSLLAIGLLLAPDLSELGISGLLSVKRKVTEQGERQSEFAAELGRIEQRIAIAQNSTSKIDLQLVNQGFSEEAVNAFWRSTG